MKTKLIKYVFCYKQKIGLRNFLLIIFLYTIPTLNLQARVDNAGSNQKTPSITNTGANIVGSSGSFWVISNGNFTLASPFANKAATMDNLTIDRAGSLTITPTSCLTVNKTLTNDNTLGAGIRVKSDSTGTGSLITSFATTTGRATTAHWMSAGKWNMVSAPIIQPVASFLAANAAVESYGVQRTMMDYNPQQTNWNPYFTNQKNDGYLGGGRGFGIYIGSDKKEINFTGSLQAGKLIATGLTPGAWNCVGNPYTSSIGINAASPASADFLNANLAAKPNLDPSYGAIYIWDQPTAENNQPGGYTIISNVPVSAKIVNIQQGQAFLIKTNTTATSVEFSHDMQLHIPNLPLKAATITWPVIELSATVNSQKSTAFIAFNDQMTKGLDPTYDLGMLPNISSLSVYTRLVEDNGIPFVIQSLPGSSVSTNIIPVGLESSAGGEVIFSSKTISLPSDYKVILEDKAAKIFTNLQTGVYKTTIAANSVIPDRFLLHTSTQTISHLPAQPLTSDLNAFEYQNSEIHIVGTVTAQAVATLYDALGRVVISNKLNEGNLNTIPTPNMSSGIYLLRIVDRGTMHSFKLVIRQ